MAFETNQWAISLSCGFKDLRLPSGFILSVGEGVVFWFSNWVDV